MIVSVTQWQNIAAKQNYAM